MYRKRSCEGGCTVFHKQKVCNLTGAKVAYRLKCQNGLCSWGEHVKYFFHNENVQIFYYEVQKIWSNRSTWTYIADKLICQWLLALDVALHTYFRKKRFHRKNYKNNYTTKLNKLKCLQGNETKLVKSP